MSAEKRSLDTTWKTQLYDDLLIEVNRDKEMGYEVLIGGDFNESIQKGKRMQQK